MRAAVFKRSIVISGHKTSVSLEDAFWQGLREIAQEQGITISFLVGEIDRERRHSNLSSAIRVFVFERLRGPALTSVVSAQDAMVADHAGARANGV